MGRFKIIWVDSNGQEILKKFDDVDKVVDDMKWRDPSCYFIGDGQTKQGYTLEQFIKEFCNSEV